MSYHVLARKWRPKSFDELVGQEPTQQALCNSLQTQRLHHAYLFTGTRGVGKTTIARILSKSLNCEQGITPKPCCRCDNCLAIDQGHFIDLMEIDAASKTKVEDTRELLDNVQYRPTHGRYKVYLIDEVHMLSSHSFNALLKTLEEPPPHVIFLLATTDPQKLPPTILSRCLQFHLKRINTQKIKEQLKKILQAESILFEDKALKQIAQAGDGSMRDALSLLDQSIAFCGEAITLQKVNEMLGTLDSFYGFDLLNAVIQSDAKKVLSIINQMDQYSPNYELVMSEWLTLIHKIAVIQANQDFDDERLKKASKKINKEEGVFQNESKNDEYTNNNDQINESRIDQKMIPLSLETRLTIEDFASEISPDAIQLYYQMTLLAKKDLPFAPNMRQGFEMAFLRIVAFTPHTLKKKKAL
jgi:DNA polymerase-3 subunit gamma/tau